MLQDLKTLPLFLGLPAIPLEVLLLIIAASVLIGILAEAIFMVLAPASWFEPWKPHRPVKGVFARTLWVTRNALGWVLLVVGLILSIPAVPLPGFLLVLAGLALVDSPHRVRLQRHLLRRRRLHKAINATRVKLGRSPILLNGT